MLFTPTMSSVLYQMALALDGVDWIPTALWGSASKHSETAVRRSQKHGSPRTIQKTQVENTRAHYS